MNPVSSGHTLTELVVSTAIIGLVFLTGLQLSASILRLNSNTQAAFFEKADQLKLETLLRQKLAQASRIQISLNHMTVFYTFPSKSFRASLAWEFDSAKNRWTLWESAGDQKSKLFSTENQIFHFPPFKKLEHHLRIASPGMKTPLVIRLRNV